ncbi:DciA family protein [Streptomyces anulatus]|uniref:DciA family protein n=1 Tax=Streptomyces anulatus TaxID=1892 RepID=UPI001C261E49|nr:DciA family protein [Streptomyces anulatus]
MSTPEPSGVDLARVALRAAKDAAKKRGTDSPVSRKPKRRTSGPRRSTEGRDPIGLGTALSRLVAERGWEAPVAGGNVLEHWDEIASSDFAGPDFARHVRAVAFDPDTGRLDLLPDSTAWATQARIIATKLLARANDHLNLRDQGALVRRIDVLRPGARPHHASPAGSPGAGALPSTPPPPTSSPLPPRAFLPDEYQQLRERMAAQRAERRRREDEALIGRDRSERLRSLEEAAASTHRTARRDASR